MTEYVLQLPSPTVYVVGSSNKFFAGLEACFYRKYDVDSKCQAETHRVAFNDFQTTTVDGSSKADEVESVSVPPRNIGFYFENFLFNRDSLGCPWLLMAVHEIHFLYFFVLVNCSFNKCESMPEDSRIHSLHFNGFLIFDRVSVASSTRFSLFYFPKRRRRPWRKQIKEQCWTTEARLVFNRSCWIGSSMSPISLIVSKKLLSMESGKHLGQVSSQRCPLS